jgi:hypothetical protein
VQSGRPLPTFWKQGVYSELVNQLLSKLSNSLSDYTTRNKTLSFIASALRTKEATLVCFLTEMGIYSRLDTGTLVRNMMLYH